MTDGIEFGGVTPILRVSDFERSVAWYTEVLGCTLEWRDGLFCSVRRGRAGFMLCQGSQGCTATWVYVGVNDADALHEELRARGANIRWPPTNYPWGAREVHVFDPDGHVLRCGADAVPGQPLGVWLDEQGGRWQAQPDGSWTPVEE